jgi:hypothetical protein
LEITPEEKWSGKKPDLTHFRIFGTQAMAHIPKQKRRKWDKKSEKCIFVGYEETTKGYRLYSPNRREIFLCRDVVFIDEGKNEPEVKLDKPLKSADDVIVFDLENLDEVGENEESESESSSILQDNESPNSTLNSGDAEVPESLVGLEIPENQDISGEQPSAEYEMTSDEDDDDDIEKNNQPEDELLIRKSCRPPKPNKKDDFVYQVGKSEVEDPVSYKEVLSRADKDLWLRAMREEYDLLMENDTWELCQLPKDRKAIKNKWVFIYLFI